MKIRNQIGIWMDHSVARLFDLNSDSTKIKSILAQVGEQDEALNLRNETLIQNKEQNELSGFFSRLRDVIINYEVLLFGPTYAKTELVNDLTSDHHFDKVKIEVKTVDKMTKNQQVAFVKEHFNTTT